MALKAIKCTQCGADLQLDDQKEFGYCLNCGSRIMIYETINIKHSGSVTLDNSEKATNCLKLADQAYAINNYLEAYNYYTKVLEYDPHSYYATFRKGMAAARSSPMGDIKHKDLMQGYQLADQILLELLKNQTDERTVELLSREHNNMTAEMKDFALFILDETQIPAKGSTLPSLDRCGRHIYIILDTLLLLESVYSVINTAVYEEYNKVLLDKIIWLCDQMSSYHLKYLSGYKTDSDGRRIPTYDVYHVPDKALERFKNCRAECVKAFNSLPSNVSTLSSINDQLQALAKIKAAREAEVSQRLELYKTGVKAFWQQNAELLNQSKTIQNKTWFIVLGGLGVCAILLVIALLLKVDILPYGAGGSVALVISIFVKLKVAKRAAAKFEDKVFPDDLKQKNNDYKAAVQRNTENLQAISKKEQEKKSFEATLKK
ncbi:MAG: hypothetical protein KBA53_03715 [Thermoclostridium sp.]|nr:hypothetical protein [Thermoclostridium sp.]